MHWNNISLRVLLSALISFLTLGPSLADLYEYDRVIATDHSASLPHTALLDSPLILTGKSGLRFDFGAVSGSATVEFIVKGDPAAGGESGFLAVGSDDNFSLRYEQFRNSARLGITQQRVADYRFTPDIPSPVALTHLAYRYDSATSRMELFRNGTLAGSVTASNFKMPSGLGYLGMRNAFGDEGMVGLMERVTVYNSKISNTDIQRHADAWIATPASQIVFNATDGTLLLNGEVQEETFRGVPFKATVFNGLARYVFAGDLEFAADDVVTGTGNSAISVTISGDLNIAEGARIDVSALAETAGPGGGIGGESHDGPAGGVGGNGGSGGTAGKGGKATGAVFLKLTQGKWGGSGGAGFYDTKNGVAGTSGSIGQRGEDGYAAPNSGGSPAFNTNLGARGLAGARGVGGGGAGAPGWPRSIEAKNGKNATGSGGIGKTGGSGGRGLGGRNGAVIHSVLKLTGGGGGAAGQAGGSGGGGGGGGGGCGGGGGGGGGSDSFTGGRAGKNGTKGGDGAKGATGGKGGRSGAGGHGGGAIEFVCYGELNVAANLLAKGSSSQPGGGGGAPVAGSPRNNSSDAGGRNTGSGWDGGAGGDGTAGGAGGTSGRGGVGGIGGNGAGGTIMFRAAVADASLANVDVRGGSRGTSTVHGRLVWSSHTGEFNGSATPGSSIENYPGLEAINTHLHDFSQTPLIPNLVGGTERAGRLNSANAWSLDLVDQSFANKRIALVRMDRGPAGYDHDFEGFDMLLFVNLTGAELSNPVLGSGPNYHTAKLLSGGLATLPIFGGNGPGVLESLSAYEIYATLIPESATEVSFGYTPQNSLELVSQALENGETAYLTFGESIQRTTTPAITHPDPELILPGAGPEVNFEFTGDVQVTITPAEAAGTPGVGWTLLGLTPVYSSGSLANDIPLGVQTVAFTRVPGWLPPRAQDITVAPGDGITTSLTVEYTPANVYRAAELAPQTIRGGEILGFFVESGTTVSFSTGSATGPIVIADDGWFSYEPDANDRQPFELTFTAPGQSPHTIEVTPLQDLPQEQTILALQPRGNDLPDPTNRDYNSIHKVEGDQSINGEAATASRIVTLSGKKIVFDDGAEGGDSFFYNEVHDKPGIQELRIYAEEVVIKSPLNLKQSKVTIYARDLVFKGPDSAINTKPKANNDGNGFAGGNIILHVLNIISDPSSKPRLVLDGGDSNSTGGAAGLLSTPFESMTDFAQFRGGMGSTNGASTQPVVDTPQDSLPVSYCWLHPIGARAALAYAKDLYYLGFMTEAEAEFLTYERLLRTMDQFETLPDLIDASSAKLQFAELANDASSHVARIADKLDYYGNPAGWVPMLSFEVNFKLTDAAISRAMDALYLAQWLKRSTDIFEMDLSALQESERQLESESDALRSEMGPLKEEIDTLVTLEGDIEFKITRAQNDLRDIESRLQEKAEIVSFDENNPPFWKKLARGAGAILQMVPVYQPALGAVGSGLDIASRIDEQDALTTAFQVANAAGEYKAASLKADAVKIEQDQKPIGPLTEEQTNEEKRMKKLEQAENIQSGLTALNDNEQTIRDFFKSNEAPKGQIDAELAKLKASDPQFAKVADDIASLMEEKALYIARLGAARNRLREIPGIIMKNALAAERLNSAAFELGGVLDPQALSVVEENARRAKDRLRKNFYLLAKSYEYRTLENFRQNNPDDERAYDPVDIFEKIEAILVRPRGQGELPPFRLSSDDYETLESALRKDLDELTTRLLARYQTRGTEPTATVTDETIRAEKLTGLNGPEKKATINLSDLGSFSMNREEQRIADIVLKDIEFTVTEDGVEVANPSASLNSAAVDISIIHSGVSTLVKDGQTYLFNHFRNGDPSANLIRWNFTVNLLTGVVTDHPESFASQSLLATLLDRENTIDLQRFSRPGARADLSVCVTDVRFDRKPDAAVAVREVEFGGMTLDYELDYFFPAGPETEFEIVVRDPSGDALDIMPRFFLSEPDQHDRQDGLGSIIRSSNANRIEITPEIFFGNKLALASSNTKPPGYRFLRWENQNGPVGANGNGDRVLAGDILSLNNNRNRRVFAVYEYTGDGTPAEVEQIELVSSSEGITEYLVTFTEPVIGVDGDDFIALAGGSSLEVFSLSPDDAPLKVHRVRVINRQNPTITFAVLDNDSILDLGGNSLAGPGEAEAMSVTSSVEPGDPVSEFDAEIELTIDGPRRYLTITGSPNQVVRLQSSSDLDEWNTFETVNLGDSPMIVEDVEQEGVSGGFYRVIK